MQKKQLTLVIVSLLVVVLSVSLAYFTAQIIGNGKNVTINSADLKIIFTDSYGAISGSNIEPGWSDTKTFTIENKSNETYKYTIVIQDLLNTFVTNGYLQYKITSTNGGYNMTEFKDVPKSSVPKDKILAYSASIPVGVTQSYTVEFIYRNDESVDQSEDMGKTLIGTLFITEGTIDLAMYAGYEEGTLGYQIMGDNPTRNTRDTYNAIFTNNTTGTLFTATEKNVHNIADTSVYYYAGNTTNNWVKFGIFASDGPIRGYSSATDTFEEYTTLEECNSASSFNTNCSYAWKKGDPMYWRIIRTNADGSVRLLYSGTSYDITEGYIGKSKFTKAIKDPMYVGYKYGTSGTLESNRTNENDSTIKTYIDTWYQNNLIVYTKYLSNNAVYCNDRELKSGEKYSTTSFFYASDERISTNKQPTYNCTNMRDAFSINNTEAKLTYPIALMTADEVSYAGGRVSTKLTVPYAWYYTNANGESITGSNFTWTLSPYYLGMFGVSVWGVQGSGSPGSLEQNYVGNTAVVRPAISLKSCVKYSSGDGTAGNPYTIKETTSGC